MLLAPRSDRVKLHLELPCELAAPGPVTRFYTSPVSLAGRQVVRFLWDWFSTKHCVLYRYDIESISDHRANTSKKGPYTIPIPDLDIVQNTLFSGLIDSFGIIWNIQASQNRMRIQELPCSPGA